MSDLTAGADDVLDEAVADTYAVAGVDPGAASLVAPLRRLIAACRLVVDEVPELTRHTAAAYLHAEAGRPLRGGEKADAADERLAGFLYANAAGGWILVDRRDPLVRRRFTIAHELGHYILHFVNVSGREKFEEEVAPSAQDEGNAPSQGRVAVSDLAGQVALSAETLERMEREADRFAAVTLMPEAVCRALVRQHARRCGGARQVLANRLASELLVSRTAMLRRLADLQLP